jgi:hypothetical protein
MQLSAATARVTLVAIYAVVNVSRNILVMEVRGIVPAVAPSALENCVVSRVRVARRAYTVRVAVINGELRVLRVVERRTRPGCSGVAILAGLREELRLRSVTRICCVLVVSLMATVTGGG